MIYKGVVVLQNCTDLLKVVPDPCVTYSHAGSQIIDIEVKEKIELVSSNNTCLTTSCDGSRVIDMNIEEITNIQEEEDPLLLTFPATKTEHKVSVLCVLCVCVCVQGLTIKLANSPPCTYRGSSGQKRQYGLMTLAKQRFTAMLLLIYGSILLSGVFYCLSVFWCAVARILSLN
jgi:hypothetical protein